MRLVIKLSAPFLLLMTTAIPCHAAGPAQPSQIATKTFHAISALAQHPHAEVQAGKGYKVIGCGARVNWGGAGNLLTALYPSDHNSCIADAKDHDVASPATIDAWAIALYDPDNRWDVKIFRSTSGPAPHPIQTVKVAPGYTMTGGGAQDNYEGAGNLLTASFPASADSWEARGKDHAHSDPASLTAFAIGIRPLAATVPSLRIQMVSVTSGVTNHPAQTVSLPPGVILASGGALADYKGAGSLLTASFPVDDGSGWIAEAKDHEFPDASALTVWAIGIARPGS